MLDAGLKADLLARLEDLSGELFSAEMLHKIRSMNEKSKYVLPSKLAIKAVSKHFSGFAPEPDVSLNSSYHMKDYGWKFRLDNGLFVTVKFYQTLGFSQVYLLENSYEHRTDVSYAHDTAFEAEFKRVVERMMHKGASSLLFSSVKRHLLSGTFNQYGKKAQLSFIGYGERGYVYECRWKGRTYFMEVKDDEPLSAMFACLSYEKVATYLHANVIGSFVKPTSELAYGRLAV